LDKYYPAFPQCQIGCELADFMGWSGGTVCRESTAFRLYSGSPWIASHHRTTLCADPLARNGVEGLIKARKFVIARSSCDEAI
jgi:hypothetical protein